MSNDREIELLQRRDEILRETAELTSNIVQSLEQQQKFAHDTKEDLHNQNLLLSLANDKMRSMNEDLTSVVNEMNEIDAHDGCLCCNWRKKKKKQKKKIVSETKPKTILPTTETTVVEVSKLPELVDNNDQEKKIIQELNQMKTQLIVFQDQVKTINKSFVEGDQIIHQLGNESDQYMNAITTALDKAEHVLGRKFVVNQEEQQQQQQQPTAREQKQADSDILTKSI